MTFHMTTLFVTLLSAALSGCMGLGKSDDAVAPASRQLNVIKSPTEEGVPNLALLEVGLGTRDFQQINQTMASLTGVDPRTGSIQSTYEAVTSALPTNNDIKTVSGPNIVGVARLAAQYCDVVANTNDARRTGMFPGIDFSRSATSITTPIRDQVIHTLLVRFTRDKTPSPEDVSELQKLFDELKASSASTMGLMVSLCTASLGSARSIVVL